MAAPPVPPDRHLPMPRPAPSTTYYNGPPPGFHPGAFLPGEVGTTYGPTNPAPPPYPGWMSPSDLMEEAQKEAQAFYGPLLAELHRQQTQLHNHNLAQQAAIQGVFQAIQGGLSGPYAQIAGNEGQLGFLGAVQDANQSEQDMAYKVMQLAQEASGKQGDFLGALQDRQAALAGDYQKAHTPTIHGSLTTGLYATYPDGTIKILRPPPEKPTAATKLSPHMVNGQLVWFDPTTGLPATDPYGTKPAPKVPPITWKTINGQLVGLDAHGNIVKTYGDKSAPGDGDLGPYIRNRRTGQLQLKPGYTYGPGGQIVSTTVPKKVPVKIIGPGGVPLTNSDITQISGGVIADINHFKSLLFHGKTTPAGLSELINHFKSQLIPNAIWMPILNRLFRVPTDFSRANLRNMSVSRLHNTAMVLAPNDFAAALQAGPQRVVNGKTVRGFAKNELIDFIVSHVGAWTPKVSAAAETAAVDFTKWVKMPPGVDRPGVSTHPGILAFAAKVAQVWGSPLTVGTGTNHNRLVKGSGNESAHWTGWAVDIPMVGGQLTKLGQDALIAAGMPEAQARKVKSWSGGDYNGYNILFNTNVGGNHYNHLHIGLRPSRQRDPSTRNLAGSQSPTSPQGARQVAFSIAESKYHWNKSEQSDLDQLWERESGWDYSIHNKKGSGAVGIPQRMPSSHPITDDFLTNPITQINWGLNYIKTRYRTPSRAWAFWRATVNKNAATAPSDLRRTAQIWIRNGWTGY